MAAKELSILLTAKDMASKTIGNVSKQVGLLGRMGGTVGQGMATLGNNLKRMGTALLAGAGITGIFSIVGALEQGISKAEQMALAVEKLSGVTGMSAHSASQLVAVFQRFGVDVDKGAVLAAFAEKTLGKLNATQGKVGKSAALQALETKKLNIQLAGGKVATINLAIAHQKAKDALAGAVAGTTKLTALDQQYGLHLVDAKGKVVDYATEVSQLADLYTNRNIPASTRAAVAAQLLGRSYVTLIPVLKLGSKGLAEAAAAADKMGATLQTADDVANVTKFIAAQRKAQETLAGMEIQLGLLVMPDLTKGMEEFSAFVASHKDEIKKFFSDGIHAAEGIGTVITGTVIPAIKGIVDIVGGIWGAIPAPLQQLLAGGFIANKLTGGMILNLAGDLFKRGGTPANPLFVADVTAGVGKGVSAAAAGTSILNMLKNGLSVGIAAASIAALAYEIGQFMNTVGQAQSNLQGQVNATGQQTPQQSAANLGATANSLFNMNILDRAIAETFSGGQITADFIGAAQRLTAATMTSADATKALPGVQRALEYAQYAGFKSAFGPLQSAIDHLKEEIAANTQVVSIADKATPTLTATADNPRYATGAARLARMGERGDALLPAFQAIFNRAWAKGKVPTDTALQATYLRNIERVTTASTAAQRTFREGERADLRKVVSSSAISAAIAAASARMLAVAQAVGAASIVAAIHGISAPKVIVNTTVSARDTKVVTQKFERYQGKLVPVF